MYTIIKCKNLLPKESSILMALEADDDVICSGCVTQLPKRKCVMRRHRNNLQNETYSITSTELQSF